MSDATISGSVSDVGSVTGEGSLVGSGVVVPAIGTLAPVVVQTAPVVKPARKSPKAKAKKVDAKPKKRGRGRPEKYTGTVKTYIGKLVGVYGATYAREILNAAGRDAVSVYNKSLRNLTLVPDALGISMPTVLKIAHKAGVELHAGRPAKAA